MKLLVTALLLFLSIGHFVSAAKDAPLSAEGLSLRDAKVLVAGVAYGFGTYNAHLILNGKATLYCAPLSLSINGRLLWQLAEKELAGPHAIDIIVISAIDGLKKTYPCKKK